MNMINTIFTSVILLPTAKNSFFQIRLCPSCGVFLERPNLQKIEITQKLHVLNTSKKHRTIFNLLFKMRSNMACIIRKKNCLVPEIRCIFPVSECNLNTPNQFILEQNTKILLV